LFMIKPGTQIDYHFFWAVPLILSLLALICVGIFFKEKKNIRINEMAVESDEPVK
jgi:hypothetical protein